MPRTPRADLDAIAAQPVFSPPDPAFEASIDAPRVAAAQVAVLEAAVTGRDWAALTRLLHPNAFLRDVLTLSYGLRTFQGAEHIVDVFRRTSAVRAPASFAVAPRDLGGPTEYTRMSPQIAFIAVPIVFRLDNPATLCRGLAKLVFDANESVWKFWTLFFQAFDLEERPFEVLPLKNVPQDSIQRGIPDAHGLPPNDLMYDVVVIGGGVAGLGAAAHCESMGLKSIVCERHPRIGHLWATRYESLSLHTPKINSHFPWFPWPDDAPEHPGGKLVAEYHASVVRALRLPAYADSKVSGLRYYSAGKGFWEGKASNSQGESTTIRARNIAVCTGFAQTPRLPVFENQVRLRKTRMTCC